jgi:uncharacterized protein YraI
LYKVMRGFQMNSKQGNRLVSTWWTIILLGAFLITQCTRTPVAKVSTPVVSDLMMDHSPSEVLPGGEMGIWVNVDVADQSTPITYTWNLKGGEIISGQGTGFITCKVPDKPGRYTVSVKIEYGDWDTGKYTPIIVLAPTPTGTPTSSPTATATFTPPPPDTPTPSPSTATFTPVPPTPTPEAVVVAVNGLNLRSGPGTIYNVIGSLKKGDILDIQGRNAAGDWIQVVPAGSNEEGWVSAKPQYVEIMDLDTFPVVEAPNLPSPAISPDAVVMAPGSVVLLRSYPGDDYGVIHTLPDGTALQVLRRVYNKDNWIKVAVNPGSEERIEGYVTTASGLIKVNVDLNDVPPIYEFGPTLLKPEPSVQRALEEPITFKWQDYGVLEEHQYYSLILYRDDLSEKDACYHDQYKVPEALIKPEDYDGCTPGVYYWGVGIATKILGEDGKPMLGEDGRLIWRDDSERDHRRVIGLSVPPPESHAGDDSGDIGEGKFDK